MQFSIIKVMSEEATEGVLKKKAFLKIAQISQENTCARVSFLIKLQASACNFIKIIDSGTDVFM